MDVNKIEEIREFVEKCGFRATVRDRDGKIYLRVESDSKFVTRGSYDELCKCIKLMGAPDAYITSGALTNNEKSNFTMRLNP